MKTSKYFVVATLFATLSFVFFSCEDNNVEILYYDFDSNTKTASVVAGVDTGNIVIPSTVMYEGEEYSVTSIRTHAFWGHSSLTSITLPSSLTSIGDNAFYGCRSLTSITIPDGVTEIEGSAFEGCYSLTSITLPSSLTSIGFGAFRDCYSLTSITIPENVTEIGDDAFSYCSGLTSVTIPEGLTKIGDDAFYGCRSLTSIDVASNNNNYTSIDGVLFSKDKTILIQYPEGKATSYVIPDGVTKIGDRAFSGCSSLTSITIPENVTEIGDGSFRYCNSLTSIDVAPNNENYASIDGVLFSKDKTILIQYPEGKATSYAIPEGVKSIGGEAFSGCSSLTSITIPENVTEIGDDAFYGCCKLYEVYNKSNLTITAGSSENGGVARFAKNVYTDESGESKIHTVGDYIFYVDEDNIELLVYLGDETAITLPSDYEGKNYKIGDYAFFGCSSLTSITIPDGVTSIGDNAFYCRSLTSITIPESVKTIGNDAFSYCRGLTSVTIPEGLTKIGDCAFEGCYSLTSITLPSSLTSIGFGAFRDCYSLTSITLPEGVTEIGYDAFVNCRSLTSVIILGSVTEIEDRAFSYCSSLTSIDVAPNNENYTSIDGVLFSKDQTILIQYPKGKKDIISYTIPGSVTKIGRYPFSCRFLTSIDVASNNENYTSIDGVLFSKDKTILIKYPEGKKDITSYTIPDGVTEIGDGAFWDCRSLTSVTIPDGVTEIGSHAFYGCIGFTSITCKNTTPPEDGFQTFDYVDKSIPLYVPAESVKAYKNSEGWENFRNIQAIP